MPKILVASSPVEIDAKADELELPKEAREVARDMFHALTDRLGKAVIALEMQHKAWPEHRFYFGTVGSEMSALLDGLTAQPAVLEVTNGVGVRQPDWWAFIFRTGKARSLAFWSGTRPMRDSSCRADRKGQRLQVCQSGTIMSHSSPASLPFAC